MVGGTTSLKAAWKAALAIAAATAVVVPAFAQGTAPRTGSAETRLVNINLFDTGLTVVNRYGSPDAIEPISIGGGQGIGPAGGGAPAGAPGGFSGGPPAAGGGPSTAAGLPPGVNPNGFWQVPGGIIGDPFGFYQGADLRQGGPPPGFRPPTGPPPNAGGGPNMGGGGRPSGGFPGGPGGAPPFGPGGPGGAPPFGPGGPGGAAPDGFGGGNTVDVQFTRWVYRRSNAQYAFVLDQFNRVVQIEAVGLNDRNVGTRRGIRFGATFAQVMQKYQRPDGYEISGDTILVRFINRDRVAFRLSRVQANKPQVVTGIVIAAGKP